MHDYLESVSSGKRSMLGEITEGLWHKDLSMRYPGFQSAKKQMISVLFVDDEPDILVLTKIFLERTGEFRVDTVQSAQEALKNPQIQYYDAIVSDFSMPGMNGIDFLKKVKKLYGNIPFILFIGEGSEEIVIDAINNGADFYLQKSGSPEIRFAELAFRVKQAVRKKQAEAALIESEERFRGIAERSSDLTLILDEDLTLTYVSPSSLTLLGYESHELLGKSLNYASKTIFAQSGSQYVHAIQRILRGEFVGNIEICLSKKDKSQVDVNLFAVPIICDGVFEGAQVSIRDVTPVKIAEKALKDSEEKFRSFVENAYDIVYSMTTNGIFSYISPRITAQLGYEPGELIGKSARLVIHNDDFPRNREIFLKAVKTGKNMNGNVYRVRHKNGSWQWHSLSLSPIVDSHNTVIRVQGISHDITVLRSSEEAIRKANRQLSLLTGITRHDILNKITIILGYLEIIEMDSLMPQQSEYLEIIKDVTNEIKTQIDFTRIYEKLGSCEPKWVSLKSIIPWTLIPEGIHLSMDLDEISLFADPMLERVFFNLLDNSIRHGKSVSKIMLSARESAGGLTVIWEDNGVGIDSEEKEKIFERGFGQNTGLGMFLVREILSLTNISIIENGTPGVGARFEIQVPWGGFKRNKTENK
ncbi:hypothetical protein DLD82_04710 [Methanospirillum stamsii]|uniref:Histidine kinase n=2 Tax=Methanospirillum stamsii TaxID=1277351 RepID=A0A2V2NGC8_9EURY|nr:hypothetical protein DLD82_04710 [Methanospirillum stamsii]